MSFNVETVFCINIEIARSKGVNVKWDDVKTYRKKYLANTCLNFRLFADNFFFIYTISTTAKMGILPFKKLFAGYYCDACLNL